MPLDVRCPGCGRTLRVADEHAGRQLRCPACQHLSIAPSGPSHEGAASPSYRAIGGDTWHLRTPEGSLYGPATSEQLDDWVAEGRVAADCELAESASGPWRNAADLFPQLKPTTTSSVEAPAVHPWTPRAVFTSEEAAANPAASFLTPHRGGLIFVLGLVGIVMTCPVLSLMAWVMGGHDLGEMQAGRMDKSGEGLTRAGYILGMIVSLMAIFTCAAILFVILLAAVAGN